MNDDLLSKTCIPCRGGVPPLTKAEAEVYLAQAPGWTLEDEGRRIERSFNPQAVRKLKATSARDISIGGPHLAAEAIRSSLVDEYRQLMVPVIVGGGNRWLPDGVRVDLELVDERRFDGGVVASRYRRRDS